MCIICNTQDVSAASGFLSSMALANQGLKAAEASLLLVAKGAYGRDLSSRYKKHHKRMVRARRALNRLDEMREA